MINPRAPGVEEGLAVAGDLIVDSIETIVSGYWSILNYTVVPPKKMGHIRDHLKVNIGSILFSTVLLLVAKAVVGFQANILDSFVLNFGIALISILVLFLIPTVIMLFEKAAIINLPPGSDDKSIESASEELSNKASSIAIFIWIWSLIFLIADSALNLEFGSSVKSWIGSYSPNECWARIVAVSLYTLLAVLLLLFRSQRSTELSLKDWIVALFTVTILGTLNATMLYYLVFVIQTPAPAHVATCV
jgi:hypothetical protein